MEVIHLKMARFHCEWPACEETFVTKSQLDCHTASAHTGQKLYKCEVPECHFESNYLKHFKHHQLRHDPNYVPEPIKKKPLEFNSDGVLEQDFVNLKTGKYLFKV